MPDPLVDAGAAKALANPVRQRILAELRTLGRATSTTLARRLGVTTGGTSYNLRILAAHGFVREAPDHSRGRQRWWQLADEPRPAPPDGELAALVQRWIAEDLDAFAKLEAVGPTMGRWAEAMPYSRGTIRVNLSELDSFFEDYLALLRRYQRPEHQTPPDARTVQTRFMAFPEPD